MVWHFDNDTQGLVLLRPQAGRSRPPLTSPMVSSGDNVWIQVVGRPWMFQGEPLTTGWNNGHPRLINQGPQPGKAGPRNQTDGGPAPTLL